MCMRVDVNIIWYYIGIYEFKKDKNVMPEEDEEEEEGVGGEEEGGGDGGR